MVAHTRVRTSLRHGLKPLAFLTTLLSLVIAPSAALAQDGSVAGTVADVNGNPLAFVEITVDGTRLGTMSDPSGAYRLAGVPAGDQTLTARVIGYRSASASVTVTAGEAANTDFSLAIDPMGMETVVVTATNSPTTKLESSVAITTMTSADIEQNEPRSTADLLKSVPGFYVESSGGEVNNNLFVRGLPAAGSYRFVVMLEDGMPAFDANDLFFFGADNLIRFDENAERLEAVRGGNSALFGTNAPGGLVNLISKTGGPELRGSLKISAATDGLTRYDANVNGPLAEDWRFSIGGYYRFDDGIRDPGFPAARGGQLKANVTRLFDRGFFRLYGKYVNDRNVFFLPLPVRAEATGDQSPQGDPVITLTDEFAAGFPDDGTLTTNDANFSRIPLPQGNGEFTLPLENGVGQVGGTVMAEFNVMLENGWSIENTLRVMNLDHENNAMPPGPAVTTAEFAQPFLDSSPAGSTAEFTFQDDGTAFNNPNGLVQNGLIWHVERPVTNFSNQFLLKKLAVAGQTTHNIRLGGYFGFYTADNLWMFNNVLTEVGNAPRLLNLNILDSGGNTIQQVTENGFTQYLGLFVRGEGNATLVSFFGGDEIQLSERVRLDLGVRFERNEYEQNIENTENFDLGGPSDADDAVGWGNRSFTRRQVDFDEWAASVGVNYLINEQTSVYGRFSKGYKVPEIDQYIFGFFPDTAETLLQAEAGIKVSSPTVGLSAVGYWAQLEDFPSQDVRINPVTGETEFVTAIVGKARTFGAEVEAVVSPYPGVKLNGQLTLQDHEYLDFLEGGTDLSGNQVRRIPKTLLNLGGTYESQGFTIGGDWSFVGRRFSNNASTVELPSYGYANARVSYTVPGEGLTFSAAVLNLAEGKGLTEGDPRFDESGAPTGFGNARPILPRRWVFAVRHDF